MATVMKGLVLIIMIAAVAVKVTEGQDAPALPPSGDRWKHLICSAECSYKCHATLRHFPLLCMTKCVAKCLNPSPSDALLSCTYNCASIDHEKQLQSIEELQQVGDNVGYCYEKCNNNTN